MSNNAAIVEKTKKTHVQSIDETIAHDAGVLSGQLQILFEKLFRRMPRRNSGGSAAPRRRSFSVLPIAMSGISRLRAIVLYRKRIQGAGARFRWKKSTPFAIIWVAPSRATCQADVPAIIFK